MSQYSFTPEQVAQYERDGYVIVEGLLSVDETRRLIEGARESDIFRQHSYGRKDATGMETRLALWHEPGEDMFGCVSRNERIVDPVEQLIGEPLFHYHTKLMMKEPKVGGAWEWHQDYGYWYEHGFLYPNMMSVWIALDEANRANGCMQVLKASHKVGRINHSKTGDQVGIDPAYLEAAMKKHELVYAEMKPGSALFFHGNLFHRSDANRSENPRWSMISCYCGQSNRPFREYHAETVYLFQKAPGDSILNAVATATASGGFADAKAHEGHGSDQ